MLLQNRMIFKPVGPVSCNLLAVKVLGRGTSKKLAVTGKPSSCKHEISGRMSACHVMHVTKACYAA